MTDLSPGAQTVLDAFLSEWNVYAIDEARWAIAAALKTAADQVVPDEEHPGQSQFWDDEADREWQTNQSFRRQLLTIATELKGQ